MKSNLFFVLISIVLFSLSQPVIACISPYYPPSCYFTYRVDDANQMTQVEQNCLLWQQLTDGSIPVEDIREVIYKWKYEDVQYMLGIFGKIEYYFSEGNKFADWIFLHGDREAAECVLLAKECEHLRKVRHKDPWYYSWEADEVNVSLSRLAERAQAYAGDRLKDRYTLQAVRALFSLHCYDDCIRLWNSRQDSLPDGLIKNMTLPYIAGCYYRKGDVDKAVSLYAACGDVNSMFHCLEYSVYGLDEVERMRLVRSYNPRYTDFFKTVHEMVRKVEKDESSWLSNTNDGGRAESNAIYIDSLWAPLTGLYDFSLELANDKHTDNRGTWYYTVAYLADKLKRPAEALRYIRQASLQKNSDEMQESIQVLDIYLSAKYAPNMGEYEARLMQDLKKMEALIGKHLTSEVIKETDDFGHYRLIGGYSFYYWNDMLRKLLLSVVAPRYLEEGNPVRAIQVTNMADNLLYQKIREKKMADCKIDLLRESTRLDNPYDWRNHLFDLLGTIDVRHVAAYTDRLRHPRSEFDHYLNSRGYSDLAYFYDIIGTKYLFQSDYAKAVHYLEKVPLSFQYRLNTFKGGYMRRDPFQPEVFLADQSDYKLNFAREMEAFRQQILGSADVNREAQARIRYAIGLRNSFESCWALTQYSKSCWESEDITRKKKNVREEYDRLVGNALSMFTDPESAARAYWLLGYYKKTVRDYPNTEIAEFARTHCDHLRDYFPARIK